MTVLCAKVEIAVLVDRKHKSFPAQPDYVGLSLATTLQENIEVRLGSDDEGVYMH
jgi:pyrimidine operon attenuation protein / uracil phosphoribosyltransferase